MRMHSALPGHLCIGSRAITKVLALGTLHIAIEATARFGWEAWLGSVGDSIGVQGFGGSAPLNVKLTRRLMADL